MQAKYKLGIIPIKKPKNLDEKEYIIKNRTLIIHQLVLDYLGVNFGMECSKTLWTAFLRKEKVRIIETGEEVYIHNINSCIEWETNIIQTRYTVKKSETHEEFKKEYTNGLIKLQQGELETI